MILECKLSLQELDNCLTSLGLLENSSWKFYLCLNVVQDLTRLRKAPEAGSI
jgi:hypothetical protein